MIPLTIHTVNPPLKESGSGAYSEAWELDISPWIEERKKGMGGSWRARTCFL